MGVDRDGDHDIADAIALSDSLFIGGATPSCLDAVVGNDDGQVEKMGSRASESHHPPPAPVLVPACPSPRSENVGRRTGLDSFFTIVL